MARNLTPAVIDEILAPAFRPNLLFEGYFNGIPVRLWNGYGDIVAMGNTYLGNGWLHGISDGPETSNLEATGIELRLTGVPQAIISLVLSESKQGETGNFYLAFRDDDGAIIADPYCFFSGKLDVPSIDEDADNPTVTITYESRLIELERAREFRYTNENQQIDYPGDTGLRYILGLQSYKGYWGRTNQTPKKKK